MFYSPEQFEEAQRDAMGDGYSNDLQRSFALSQMNTELRNERPEANQRTLNGQVVIMEEIEHYCSITDAFIGCSWVIVKIFPNRDWAEAWIEASGAPENVFIYESPSVHLTEPAPEWDDSIPF